MTDTLVGILIVVAFIGGVLVFKASAVALVMWALSLICSGLDDPANRDKNRR